MQDAEVVETLVETEPSEPVVGKADDRVPPVSEPSVPTSAEVATAAVENGIATPPAAAGKRGHRQG